MRKNYSIEELKTRLKRYCAYQERCHKEVKNKLQQLGAYGDISDAVISHLIQHDYLNETRFAVHYVRGKFSIKKWGKKRILNELKLRKITTYNIDKGLKQISEKDYEHSFDTLAQNRWEELKKKKESIEKRKKKWVQYLQYRGWENDLIFGA